MSNSGAMSGKEGKVYRLAPTCEFTLDGTKPNGTSLVWPDLVTRFSYVRRAEMKRFGHDKSHGYKDACAGIKSVDISLHAQLVVQDNPPDRGLQEGDVVWLELSGIGLNCGGPAQGLAVVEQISYEVDIDTGAPVAYDMSLVNKGAWTDAPFTSSQDWGGFECDCTDTGSDSANMEGDNTGDFGGVSDN